jgi:hypothetical protein
MSTIITRNSANSGSQPSSLIQGELAINVTDGKLFYGSGSGNVVKEFVASGSGGGGTIDTGSFVTTSSFNAYTGSNTSQFAGTASYATTASYYGGSVLSASYAQTASYAPAYLPLTGGTIDGNVTINGTASIAFLNVTYESASVIYSSGSNQFGDASNDVQTLWGIVDIKSGPVLVTGSVIANSFTGSLLGTASYALNALSASYAITASYVENAQTASYVLSASYASTASYVENAQTASYVTLAQTASYVQTAQTASYVLQAVSASFATLAQTANTASYVVTAQTASYVLQAVSASYATTASFSTQALSASYAQTASYAVNAVSASYATTASYVQNAQTASYVLQAVSASYATTASYSNTSTSASYAQTASYVLNAVSASYATTASYATYAANGGVTKILAGANVNLSPISGLGDVTVTSFGTNLYNTATGSYGSFYDTGSVLATSTTTIYSMSLNTTDISNGVFVSASNGNNTRVKFTNAGTYNLQFSSQFSNTDNSTQDAVVWIRKNGTDVTDSAGTVGVPPFKAGSNGQVIAAWNYYLSLSAGDFIQMCWHVEQANVITLETIPAGVSPTHPRTPSTILTATRVDTFLSNTGSFSGSFTGDLLGTASYATQALSASWAPSGTSTPTFPYTGSAIISGSLEVTGSLLVQDIAGNTNIDSLNRQLYGAAPPLPPGAPSVLSIDWSSRTLNDSSGVSSVAWRDRSLYTPNGTTSLNWSDDTILNSNVYQRDFKSAIIQNAVSDTYSAPSVSYLGDVIEVDGISTFIDVSVTEGMLVYLNTDATWYPVNQASITATYLLGIAHNVFSGTGYILLEGHVVIDDTLSTGPRVAGAAYGSPVYIRDNTNIGQMATAIPTTTGGPNIVRLLGHCYQQNAGQTSQWMMKFRPSNDWVEI